MSGICNSGGLVPFDLIGIPLYFHAWKGQTREFNRYERLYTVNALPEREN